MIKTDSHTDKSRLFTDESNKIIPNKSTEHYQSNKDSKLRRKLISPILKQSQKSHGRITNSQHLAGIPFSTMTTYYPPYSPSYSYPLMELANLQVQNSAYRSPSIPIAITSTSIMGTNVVCPYVNGYVSPALLPTPIAQSPTINNTLSTYILEDTPQSLSYIHEPSTSYSCEPIASSTFELLDDRIYYELIGSEEAKVENLQGSSQPKMMLESYLKLPKDLFPSPRTMDLDPNPLIDEFCKIKDIRSKVQWLLDLEFGIPKLPITRPIPSYNVKFNSIHCKNALDAIHPGFESCNQSFKSVFLFYYDYIVSSWYRGYMLMNTDRSVENFQSWLLLPMQALGMCWL